MILCVLRKAPRIKSEESICALIKRKYQIRKKNCEALVRKTLTGMTGRGKKKPLTKERFRTKGNCGGEFLWGWKCKKGKKKKAVSKKVKKTRAGK